MKKASKKYKSESEFFKSKEFKEGIYNQVKKDTWGKGLPMVYMNDKGEIVKHWKNGKIKVIKKSK